MRVRIGVAIAAVAVAVTAAAVVGAAGVVGASPTPGPIRVWVKASSQGTTAKHPGKILITGAIGDYGTTVTTNAAGKPAKNGGYQLLKLKKGTIFVDATQFDSSFSKAKPTVNQTNCSVTVVATGPVTVTKGTGAYAGISGSVAMTAYVAGVAPRTKKNACTLKTSAKPLATYTVLIGTGTVSFS